VSPGADLSIGEEDPMRLYHVTRPEAVGRILASGFIDHTGYWGTTEERTGVWLSDKPLNGPSNIVSLPDGSEMVFEVDLDLTEQELDEFERKAEVYEGYREWLVPAILVNAHSTLRIMDEDEVPEIWY
jgi:hypothetical protein